MSSHLPDRQNPSTAEVDAARIPLSRLGLRAEDLLDAPVPVPNAPTFREYIPIVAAGVRPGTRRVYGSYWNRIDKHWGERRIDEPTPSQIRQLGAPTAPAPLIASWARRFDRDPLRVLPSGRSP
jgi:hypothetical protein